MSIIRKTKPKKHTSTNVFKGTTRDNGLPGKSYLWILTIDAQIKRLLSMLCKKSAFELYIASLLRRFYRSKDREKETISYLNFLATNDESRLYFIYPTKTFSRLEAIKFISLLNKDILLIEDLRLRLIKQEKLTEQEAHFYNDFLLAWNFDEITIDFIKNTLSEIQDNITIIYNNHKAYIIKMLMTRRKSEYNPENLFTDVYEVIMTMLDQYNLRRKDDDPNTTKKGKGKVPFTRQLDWLVKNKKNLIIQEELGGTNGDYLMLSMSEEQDEEKDRLNHNNLMFDIEESLQDEKENVNTKNPLIELGIECLPKPLNQLVTVNYKLVNPLSIEEQIEMLLAFNNFK